MAEVGAPVTQNLGTIDPSSLIGRADPNIVTPQATSMLADAFRQGVVSADDVISRIGQLGQTKKKAEIDIAGSQSMLAQEAMSPEAVAARDQQRATQMAEGQFAQADAERKRVLSQYPAVEYFDKLAAKSGIEAPRLSDGSPDYKEMEKIGLELAIYQSNKADAQAERENINAHFDDKNQVVRAFTKQGGVVDPNRVVELNKTISTPFSRQAPGTSSVAPAAAPAVEARTAPPVAVAVPTDMDAARAQLVESGVPAEQVVTLSAQDIAQRLAPPPAATSPVVEARAPVGGALPYGTPVAGGIAMGGRPETEVAKPVVMASEQQRGLAQSALTKEQLKSIGDSFQGLQSSSPWLTGPLMGRLGTLVASDNWDTGRADFTRATTAILANLAKGIYHETGVLSDKDIARYQKALPGVNDTADVAKIKLAGVTRDIFNSIDSNIETIKGQGQAITPIIQGMQDGARAELQRLNSGTAPAAAAINKNPKIRTTTGKFVQRNLQGKFVEVE